VETSEPSGSTPSSILIFDSGAGGLSILREIRETLPGTPLHYLMDTGLFPYGSQSDEVLSQRIPELCCAAVERFQPAVLVLACNTASTLALPLLRAALTIPVVGVVPAIRVAAGDCRNSGQSAFGLLATPATVKRPYTDQLIADFASDLTVHRFGSPLLVNYAERYIRGENVANELAAHLGPWLTENSDVRDVVLGCTHYPLLRPLLEQLWPDYRWIDSGKAVARQTERVLMDTIGKDELEQPTKAITLNWTGHEKPNGAARYLQNLGNVSESGVFMSVGTNNPAG